MKITIIGCGYVGTAVARLWSQSGHEVTVTTTSSARVAELEQIAKRVLVLKGTDINALQDVVADRDVVLLSVGARDRRLEIYREIYLETAKNLVTVFQGSDRCIGQLIYTSSYGILGNCRGEWVTEETPVAPPNENSQILYETEQVLLSAEIPQLKVCILRLAGIYGTGRELIKIFKSLSGATRTGIGEDFTNWVHLEDIVNAIELIRLKQLQGIYHLSSDEVLTMREFFDRLFTKHNLPSVTWDKDNLNSSRRAYNLRLSNHKIKAAGLELTHPQIVF
jgi:nucleoside-diphosphate-sugar epimerase